MKKIDDIKLINQPCDSSCGAACIAMITGKDVFEIIGDLPGAPPFCKEDIIKCLVRNNILPIFQNNIIGPYIYHDGIYLLILKSKNKSIELHCCVGVLNNGYLNLLDPAIKNKYSIEENWESNVIECIRLIDCSD